MRKVRYVAQIQQTECGLCAIAMILNYYDAHYSLYDIRQSVQVGRDGISAANLLAILGKFEMNTQAYRCDDISVLQKLTVPLIVMIYIQKLQKYLMEYVFWQNREKNFRKKRKSIRC